MSLLICPKTALVANNLYYFVIEFQYQLIETDNKSGGMHVVKYTETMLDYLNESVSRDKCIYQSVNQLRILQGSIAFKFIVAMCYDQVCHGGFPRLPLTLNHML